MNIIKIGDPEKQDGKGACNTTQHLKSMVKMSVPTRPNCIIICDGSSGSTSWKFWATVKKHRY